MTDSDPDSITNINRSGGADLNAGRDITIGGDVVGRDKIIQNIQNIDQRARTAAEEAELARSFEAQRLAQGVSAFARRLQARAGESTDADKGGPYKGLLDYRLSDAEIFFGRDHAIRELLEHLQRSPLTVLHAESGAGKTSLLQAGISPHLIAAGHLPAYLRPYNVAPALALKRAFLPNLSDTPNLAQAPLRDFLTRVGDVLGTGTTLYIFLDQFEEFFTQLEEPARPEFVRELAECLDDESLNVRWVLALRSEYFANLASFRPRIRNPFENDYRLNRLTRDEARAAVAEPAAQRGISFEAGLIDTILNDLGKDEVAPPQVQLVCSTLYEALPSEAQVITRELYAVQGGAAGILRGHLGRVLKRDLPAGQRSIAQRLLEELITSDIHRVMRTQTELVDSLTARGVQTETLDAVLAQLVDSRLLRVEETEGEPAYELAHDYLLDEIKLDPAVQARKAAQELMEQELRAYRRYGALLPVDRLKVVERYRAELHLTSEAEELISKSRKAVQRERSKRRSALLLVGLIIAAIAAVFSVVWQLRSREAERGTQVDAMKLEAQQMSPLIRLEGGDMIFGTDAPYPDRIEAIAQTVKVETFEIERTEVTNRQYQLCVTSGHCTPPTDTTFTEPQSVSYPVVFVTARQAAEYCAWIDRRLPTEIEWERAARGLQGRPWPWGSEPPSATTANQFASGFKKLGARPVGSFLDGATPEGILDLGGNVLEWTSTPLFISSDKTIQRSVSWNGVDDAMLVVRDAAYTTAAPRITAAISAMSLDFSDSTLGFRCAKSS